jgi:hypothetical protein
MKILIKLLVIILLFFVKVTFAQHVALPPVNLGLTNFLDGIAFPGILVEEYVEYYNANDFKDTNGHDVPGKNKLDTLSFVTHLAYITHKEVFGGNIGFETVIPFVYLDINQAMGAKGDKTAVGDITVSPLLIQWHSKLFGQNYFHRFAFSLIFPTGKYDSDDDVNIGSHVYSINPYYSFTYFLTPKLTISSRIHYLWNSDNDKPVEAIHADEIQPGQAIHFNYATSYEIVENFRLGLAGYYLNQISSSKIDNKSLKDSSEEVFAFGPGMYYMTRNKFQFHLNFYHEFVSSNRPIGDKLVFRVARAF